MYCQNCQKEIADDSSFCVYCGHKVKRCSRCHKLASESDLFCSQCGKSLTSDASSYNQGSFDQPVIKEQIEGHYQPLKDVPFEEVKEDNISFDDVPTPKKVNFKIVGIAFAVLIVFTVIGYYYINNGNNPSFKDNDNTSEIIQNDIMIQSTTATSSLNGNLNMNGTSFFDGKTLYVCDNNGYIVKMDSKLENRVTLVKQKSQYLNVINDIIYYTNENNNLCSITTDGKDQKIILNKTIFYLVVKADKAYYQLDEGKGVGEYICVYDLKTNKETVLNKRASYNLNVLDNKIYYSSNDGIYSMNLDGKSDEKLVSDNVKNVIVQDGKIYFDRESSGYISSFDINSKKIEDVVTKDNTYLLNITEQYIFYLNKQYNVMRYDLKSKEVKSIYNSTKVGSLQVVGDKLIIDAAAETYSGLSQYKVIMDFDGNVQQKLFAKNDGSYI